MALLCRRSHPEVEFDGMELMRLQGSTLAARRRAQTAEALAHRKNLRDLPNVAGWVAERRRPPTPRPIYWPVQQRHAVPRELGAGFVHVSHPDSRHVARARPRRPYGHWLDQLRRLRRTQHVSVGFV